MNRDLSNRLVDALLELGVSQTIEGRTSLFLGIPPNIIGSLSRSDTSMTDLDRCLNALANMGRLTETGERPLVIVMQNALRHVRGTEVGERILILIQELEEAVYGQDVEPLVVEDATPERLVFEGCDWRLPYAFVEVACKVGKGVSRLQVIPYVDGLRQSEDIASYGTGWLIAPNLMLTNYHVIEARNPRVKAHMNPIEHPDLHLQAKGARIWFDYHIEGGSHSSPATCTELLAVSPFRELDYAVLRLEWDGQSRMPMKVLNDYQPILVDSRLNIVQHAGGGPLKYAIRNNFYVGKGEREFQMRYVTDTEPGASGSPIFNDSWEVIGMHHASRKVPEAQHQGRRVQYHNEGIRLTAILEDLHEDIRGEIIENQRKLRNS